MPSPTSRTRPTSLAWSWLRYWLISLESTETISSALNLMAASFQELVFELVESGPHRAVELPIADTHHETAKQSWIYLFAENWVELENRADIGFEPFTLLIIQRQSGTHLDAHPPLLFVQNFLVGIEDRREQ